MKAIVVSTLIVKFNMAMQDAHDRSNLIDHFQLESDTENELLYEWMSQAGASSGSGGVLYEYNGIPIKVFVPPVDVFYNQYGINPTMDKHAVKNGLPHWSCVSPKNNKWWVRVDGKNRHVSSTGEDGYITDLRNFDKTYPMGE